MAAEKRPSSVNDVKYETLEDVIKMQTKFEKDSAKAVAEYKKSLDKKTIEEMEKFRKELEENGIKTNENLRKQLALRIQSEVNNQALKDQIEVYKKTSVLADKERKKEEKKNKQLIDIYKERDAYLAEGDTKSAKNLEKFAQFIEKNGTLSQQIIDTSKENLKNTFKGLTKAISDGLNVINKSIETYANYQLAIDTRLQGTGSSFSKNVQTLKSVAFSPLYKTEDLYSNLSNMIAEGIASNVEQRAFLQTVKEGIATTFDANDKALRRIIRLQQNDTTAARLGMESYLTYFLNSFVQNTEYLTTTFDSVSESLLQASSLLNAQASTEFEYVVQKWLGSLTGVGLSEATASGIAQVLGFLGSGDISSLSGSNLQNLLVMAAGRTKWDYGSLLTEGLNAEKTNELLQEMVNYLKSIDTNNNVVASQFANTFGVTISDLKALRNLTAEEIKMIASNNLSYGGMYNELYNQMNTYSSRLGISKIMENLFGNFTFSTGMNIASNPVMYAIWKITDMIQGVTGGIHIPFVSTLGTGVDPNATIENLMKLGLVGVSTLGSIGDIITGVSTAFAGNGSKLLSSLGIQAGTGTIITRGKGFTSDQAFSKSMSTFVATSSGEDYSGTALANVSEQIKTESGVDTDDPLKHLRELLTGTADDILLGQRLKEISDNTAQINSKIGDSTNGSTIIGLMSLQP